jgi:hypothetical protein
MKISSLEKSQIVAMAGLVARIIQYCEMEEQTRGPSLSILFATLEEARWLSSWPLGAWYTCVQSIWKYSRSSRIHKNNCRDTAVKVVSGSAVVLILWITGQ